MKPLSSRQQAILNRVIDMHIETAQPVGSRTITELYSELYRSSYSPATVRNEMGILEGLGYLTHPHTSAGRIPTDRGYRYYVNHSVQEEKLPEDMVRRLNQDLMVRPSEEEGLAEKACRVMAGFSNEVSIVLVSRKGSRQVKFFLQGSSSLLEKPEFCDLEKIRLLLKAFEEKGLLAGWLQEKTQAPGVSVSIGRENEVKALQDCAIVSTRYEASGELSGTVAVIGPCRMRYSRAMPLVSQISRLLGRALENGTDY